jgi:hypothetical protein
MECHPHGLDAYDVQERDVSTLELVVVRIDSRVKAIIP